MSGLWALLCRLLRWPASRPIAVPSQPPPPPAEPSPPGSQQWVSCIDWVLQCEGGYVDDPRDPGGITNMGVTIETLSRYLGRAATPGDVQNLTRATAEQIYYRDYWHASRCDEMLPGVDLMLLDCVVMSGPGRPHRWLQHAVGAVEDGVLGPDTMARVSHASPEAVVQSMTSQRLRYYQSLETWEDFGKGWTSRIQATHDRALRMAATS